MIVFERSHIFYGLSADRMRAKRGSKGGALAWDEEGLLNLQNSPTVAPLTPSIVGEPCHLHGPGRNWILVPLESQR